jgi:hypothetical protein
MTRAGFVVSAFCASIGGTNFLLDRNTIRGLINHTRQRLAYMDSPRKSFTLNRVINEDDEFGTTMMGCTLPSQITHVRRSSPCASIRDTPRFAGLVLGLADPAPLELPLADAGFEAE